MWGTDTQVGKLVLTTASSTTLYRLGIGGVIWPTSPVWVAQKL